MFDKLFLTQEAARLLSELSDLAIEYQAICMQAPIIWDGENPEDIALAKKGCNGSKGNANTEPTPPCPLRKLCLEAALASNSTYGVWGGLSSYERRKLEKKTT